MATELPQASSAVDDTRALAALIHEAPVAILAFDQGGAITAWNPAAEAIFGYSPEEAASKTLRDLLGPATPNNLDSPLTFTAPAIRKDGRPITCEWKLAPMRDDKGALPGRAAFVRDKTEEENTRAALAHQRGLLTRVLDNAPFVLWSVDKQGTFTMSEGSGLIALGLAPGQVVGLNAFDVYRDVPAVIECIQAALQGVFSMRVGDAGGRCWESRYMPTEDENGRVDGVLGLAFDITERIEAERALRQKLDLIEQQETAIRTLSTPIVRVWKEVLALPLVGVIDAPRAERILSTLLEAVVHEQAEYVILEMTGIGEVDETTADHLFKVLRALDLLGATAIVTGVKPGVATALVRLGVSLGSVVTLGNLEEALRFVMKPKPAARRPASAGKPA